MSDISRRQLLGAAGLLANPAYYAAASAIAKELQCDVAVIGGGVGGFAAALSALREGMRVVLTEETDWIGEQLTSQGVPPDEHPWIEMFGCTRSYRAYRNAVRDYYRKNFNLTPEARAREDLNPGNGTVSNLTHEFRVSVAVLEGFLAPYRSNGQLTVLLGYVPESAVTLGDQIASVTVQHAASGEKKTLTARCFIDATELGDLLPLVKAEFVTCAESQQKTGEMHAATTAQPANSQSITYCFAIDLLEGEDHTIKRPRDYSFWRDYVPDLKPMWTGKLLSWTACEPKSLAPRRADFVPNPQRTIPGLNLWTYRRLTDRNNFAPGTYASDITLVNWPENDYWLGDVVTAKALERKEHLRKAKELSLSWLYRMQTDAPRPDGGHGWKGLRLRKDIMDTEDGLAKAPYIREARRIQAEFTVLEQHVGTDMRRGKRGPLEEITAEPFADSVGVGCYRIDLHPTAGGTNYVDVGSLPFQIPLGALNPKRLDNLLAACKNIGTTHITNGCYRLHPVEWNIGEAAGALAAFAIKAKIPPRAIRRNKHVLADFQTGLQQPGFQLTWPRTYPV